MAQGRLAHITSGQTTKAGKPKWGVKLEGDDTWYNTTNPAFQQSFKPGDTVTLDASEFHGSMWFNEFSGQPVQQAVQTQPQPQPQPQPSASVPVSMTEDHKQKIISWLAIAKEWIAKDDSDERVMEKLNAVWKMIGSVGRGPVQVNPPPTPEPAPDPSSEINDDIPF